MKMSNLNLEELANIISPPRSYKLSDVKDKIVRVAFDVCVFKDDDNSKLWEIKSANDGDYIVAMFDDSDEKIAKASDSKAKWDVIVKNSELNIFYKKEFLAKFSAKSLGFEEKELPLVQSYLPKTLASDEKLVRKLFGSLDENVKNKFLSKYPELA